MSAKTNYVGVVKPNPGNENGTLCEICGALLVCLSCGNHKDTCIAELKAALNDGISQIHSLLTDTPLPNGEWPHLVICSSDRRKRPGTKGCSCCCKPVGSQRIAELEDALERMRAPVSDKETLELTKRPIYRISTIQGDYDVLKLSKNAKYQFCKSFSTKEEANDFIIARTKEGK